MAKTHTPPDISYLKGHIPEPYQKAKVLEAGRSIGFPFTLGEVIAITGLPTHICHRVLSRLVKDGTLTRTKMKKSYPLFCTHTRSWRPGALIRRVYLYKFAEPK